VTSLLEVSEVSKSFDGVVAVDGMSMTLCERRITSIIGPNGSGKTTLLNLIGGFVFPDRGDILLRGQRISGMRPYRIAALGVARTFQNLRLLRRATLIDNVLLAFQHQAGEGVFCALTGWKTRREEKASQATARELLAFVGLEGKAYELAGSLSYGQQKLVTLACCLAMEADLLLLDEPVAGIDPEMSRHILELLAQLRQEGKTILLIEHDLEAVKAVSDTVIVLDEGRKIAEGRPDKVMRDPVVVEAYLT